MISNIRLAFMLIIKKIRTQGILVFQTVIALLLFVLLIGKLQFIYNSKITIETFNDQEAYYFMPYQYVNTKFNIEDELLNSHKELNVNSGEIINCYFEDGSENGVYAYGYDDEIINLCNLPIMEGCWFNENKNKTDHIPAIDVCDRYSVGDIITLERYPEHTEYTLEIVGKLAPNTCVLSFDKSGSSGSSSIEHFLSKTNCDLIIPYNSNMYVSIQPSKNDNYRDLEKSLASILFIENQDKTPEEIMEILGKYGHSTYIKDMITNYTEDIIVELTTYGAICLIFTFLTLVGLGGNNGIQNMLNEHQYTIYYMLGASQKRIVGIEMLRGGIIVMSSFVFSVLIFLLLFPFLYANENYLIGVSTFAISGIYLSLIYVLTSAIFIYRLSKKNLIHVYKK